MEGILGRKLGMTQIFTADGATVPVTVVEAGPCVVVALRTVEKDGYDAVQIGLVEAKPPRKVTKPMQGHFKKAASRRFARSRSFAIDPSDSYSPGDQIKVSIFAEKDWVDAVGVSKGKGFQGVVKRHGFRGGRASHGSMFHRAPGSIGGSSNPSRVFPGMKSGGRMGGARITTKNLLVVKIDEEKNLIYLRGSVPGARNGYVALKRAKPRLTERRRVMKIAVRNFDNKTVKELDLPEEIFSYPYKQHLIHTAVQAYLAGLRAGTHKTKVRSEVSGSGKKLWKQKGTGRARMGSIRSPLFRKGGTVHGPTPRDYSKALTPGEKRNALKSALSRKAKENGIIVLESLEVGSPKTKALATLLSKLGAGGKVLLVDRFDNEKLALASRNHPAIKTVDALGVNVYDVVDRPFIVVSEQALGRLVEVLGA